MWLDSSVILPSGSMMPAKPHKSNGASVSSPSTPAAPVAGPSSTRSLGNGSSEITHAKQRTSQTPGIRNGSTRPRKQVGRGRAVADHDHGPARKRTKLAAEIPGTSLKPQVYVHGELGGSLPAVEDPTYLRCGWKNCREAFWTLDDLTEHLHGPQGVPFFGIWMDSSLIHLVLVRSRFACPKGPDDVLRVDGMPLARQAHRRSSTVDHAS